MMVGAPPVIVVVEDDLSTQKALGRLLRASGFETVMFSSAEAFLDATPPPEPMCLVLDVHLGAMSGLDLQRHLKACGSDLPIIVMTAFADDRVRAEAYRNGCFAFLPKESAGEDLIALIKSVPR